VAGVSRGHDRERDVRELLDSWGFVTVRAAGSLGPIDVVAIGSLSVGLMFPDEWKGWLNGVWPRVLFIEVKSTAKGPYERFGPAARQEAREVADKADAMTLLAWWPPVSPGIAKISALRWIPPSEWPS